ARATASPPPTSTSSAPAPASNPTSSATSSDAPSRATCAPKTSSIGRTSHDHVRRPAHRPVRRRPVGHRIVAAVLRQSPSDASLGDAAARLRVPVLQPARINAPDVVRQIAALQPDLGVSVACNQILRAPIREAHALGVINFHAGKLPFYRGRNIINWAIINGETEIGLTGHYVDDGIDTGDIITQVTLPIGWTDGYGDVLRRVVERMPSLVVDTVREIANGTAQRRRQADHPGTYFGGRGEGDEWIDWNASSRTIHNFIRAISEPGP